MTNLSSYYFAADFFSDSYFHETGQKTTLEKKALPGKIPDFAKTIFELERNDSDKPHNSRLIIDLPQENILHIFSYLSAPELAKAQQVCRDWNTIGNETTLWDAFYRKDHPLAIFKGKKNKCNYINSLAQAQRQNAKSTEAYCSYFDFPKIDLIKFPFLFFISHGCFRLRYDKM